MTAKILTASLFFLISCHCNKHVQQKNTNDDTPVGFAIKGMSLEATNSEIFSENILPLKNIHCNWIAQMPFAFSNVNQPSVRFDPVNSWWGETDIGLTKTTKLAKAQGFKTMMKPQIWINGSFTGAFTLESEANWQIWENDYKKFIVHFATLAETLGIEMFCIGTELKIAVKERPKFWVNLIKEVRAIYHGKLIYAANWDEYSEVPFWNQLDFIGIDAYFPNSNTSTPTVEEVVEKWQPHINKIDLLRKKFNKEVIFTELGYKSVDHSGNEPWSPASKSVNMITQANLYKGFFKAFGSKEWFKGVFFWKWHPEHAKSGGVQNDDFTPQNKPVEEIIKNAFR